MPTKAQRSAAAKRGWRTRRRNPSKAWHTSRAKVFSDRFKALGRVSSPASMAHRPVVQAALNENEFARISSTRNPQYTPSQIVRMLRGMTDTQLRNLHAQQHKELKKMPKGARAIGYISAHYRLQKSEHNLAVREMTRRGIGHSSPV